MKFVLYFFNILISVLLGYFIVMATRLVPEPKCSTVKSQTIESLLVIVPLYLILLGVLAGINYLIEKSNKTIPHLYKKLFILDIIIVSVITFYAFYTFANNCFETS